MLLDLHVLLRRWRVFLCLTVSLKLSDMQIDEERLQSYCPTSSIYTLLYMKSMHLGWSDQRPGAHKLSLDTPLIWLLNENRCMRTSLLLDTVLYYSCFSCITGDGNLIWVLILRNIQYTVCPKHLHKNIYSSLFIHYNKALWCPLNVSRGLSPRLVFVITDDNSHYIPSQQLKYKEKFDKEMKGKKPQYDLKDSKIYQTLKDANVLASEVGAHRPHAVNHLTQIRLQ